MIIKLVTDKGDVRLLTDVRLLVVEDSKGDPVSVAAKSGIGDGFTVACIDDTPRFNQVLHNLGIDKTIIRVPVDPKLIRPERLPVIV